MPYYIAISGVTVGGDIADALWRWWLGTLLSQKPSTDVAENQRGLAETPASIWHSVSTAASGTSAKPTISGAETGDTPQDGFGGLRSTWRLPGSIRTKKVEGPDTHVGERR